MEYLLCTSVGARTINQIFLHAFGSPISFWICFAGTAFLCILWMQCKRIHNKNGRGFGEAREWQVMLIPTELLRAMVKSHRNDFHDCMLSITPSRVFSYIYWARIKWDRIGQCSAWIRHTTHWCKYILDPVKRLLWEVFRVYAPSVSHLMILQIRILT